MTFWKITALRFAWALSVMTTCALPIRADDAKPDPAEPPKVPAVTRLYDVRSLIVPQFPLETSPHGEAFAVPGNFPHYSRAVLEFSGTTSGLSNSIEAKQRRGDAIEVLTKLIIETVAQDTWRENGGAVGMLREIDGMLVITQTPENHKQIAGLLRDYGDLRTMTVRTIAGWVLLPAGETSKLLRSKPVDLKERIARGEVDRAAPTSFRQRFVGFMRNW